MLTTLVTGIHEIDKGDPTRVPSGVDGRVELHFARRGARTVLVRSQIETPMAMIRPFELSDGRAVVQLITLGPGLCGGDRVRADITADEGTRVAITTTAATRIMTMDADQHAEQHVTLTVGRGALLEYYPTISIPFPGSALTQSVHVEAASDARVGVLEGWALGRTARHEYLEFRRISSRTTLSIDGVLRYADATQMEPADGDLSGAGILAGHRYLASGVWYGADLCPGGWRGGEDGETLTAFAQSSQSLVYLRALARDGCGLDAVLRRSIDDVAAAWGIAPLLLDRFHP
jgi:urease accessory protein